MTIAGIAFLVAGVALALHSWRWIEGIRFLAAIAVSLGAAFLTGRHGLAPGLAFAIATLIAAIAGLVVAGPLVPRLMPRVAAVAGAIGCLALAVEGFRAA